MNGDFDHHRDLRSKTTQIILSLRPRARFTSNESPSDAVSMHLSINTIIFSAASLETSHAPRSSAAHLSQAMDRDASIYFSLAANLPSSNHNQYAHVSFHSLPPSSAMLDREEARMFKEEGDPIKGHTRAKLEADEALTV